MQWTIHSALPLNCSSLNRQAVEHHLAKTFGTMNIPHSEHIERAALEDLHRAATPDLVKRLGLAGLEQGSAFVSLAAALPPTAIVINRAIGLGLGQAADDASLDGLAAAYRRAGVRRYFVQLHPDALPDDLAQRLEARGLQPARAWQKFSRGREPVPERPTDLQLAEIGVDHGAAFGAIVSDAFDLGEAAAAWLAGLPGRPDWHVFMSFEDGEPAGTGAMFVQDGQAWLDYGATRPAFRRRGSQGAVLVARLRRALDLGCRQIHTCTGVAASGDPQHSYGNILRMGFQKTYVRANFAPAQAADFPSI
jgi:GNAT superfamily N-acetyltransferase